MTDLILTTLVHLGLNLLVIGMLASPLLLFRRGICAWMKEDRVRFPLLFAIVVLPVGGCTVWQQFHAPLHTFSGPVARYWIKRAAEAPTREERVQHVSHVVLRSDYGGFIAWGAIHRAIADRATRCDLFRIAAAAPTTRETRDRSNWTTP